MQNKFVIEPYQKNILAMRVIFVGLAALLLYLSLYSMALSINVGCQKQNFKTSCTISKVHPLFGEDDKKNIQNVYLASYERKGRGGEAFIRGDGTVIVFGAMHHTRAAEDLTVKLNRFIQQNSDSDFIWTNNKPLVLLLLVCGAAIVFIGFMIYIILEMKAQLEVSFYANTVSVLLIKQKPFKSISRKFPSNRMTKVSSSIITKGKNSFFLISFMQGDRILYEIKHPSYAWKKEDVDDFVFEVNSRIHEFKNFNF